MLRNILIINRALEEPHLECDISSKTQGKHVELCGAPCERDTPGGTAGNAKSPVVGNVFGLQECGRLCVWRRVRWLGGGVRMGRTTLRLWLCSEGHMELRTAFHKGQACSGSFSKDSSALWVENFRPSG